MFGMPDITTSISSPAPGPSADPGVGLGGTTTPSLAHSFGSGHIPCSTPFAEDFHSLRLVLSPVFVLMGGGSGYVKVGSTPYIPSYVPSSTALFPLDAVVMINPPYFL